ncbi:MAG: TonB C-terminal domain-containing protein [Candidatus Dadabacteria bacterium]|nr:MAG: TonB C-terminal domain-containing protein [Candidatus Dadabacteria bacterium]
MSFYRLNLTYLAAFCVSLSFHYALWLSLVVVSKKSLKEFNRKSVVYTVELKSLKEPTAKSTVKTAKKRNVVVKKKTVQKKKKVVKKKTIKKTVPKKKVEKKIPLKTKKKKVPIKKKPPPTPTPSFEEAIERIIKKHSAKNAATVSAVKGKQGGGIYRPPEFFTYLDTLEEYLKKEWRWHNPEAKLKAAVCFNIAPSGAISNISLCQSSGSKEFDESVLRAVYKANPVPSPPPKVYIYFKKVKIIFEPE